MTFFTFIASILCIMAVVLLFGLTPQRITEDLFRIISPKQTLRDKVKISQEKKKGKRLAKALYQINNALIATGKEKQFATICALSLTLFICGGLLAVLINNLFLVPIVAISLALIPFIYAKTIIGYYEKHIEEEIETALSIITTSYLRSDDIVSAVKENIHYLKPPINEIFKSFYVDTTAISSDIKKSLYKLKNKIHNEIFKEWCDTLIGCQEDRTLKSSLLPVVNKLTDVRIVNNELKTILYEPRREYFMMAILTIGNIPLLYMLNKDWYHTLMDTIPGKFVLALTGVVILITALFMMKYTKPIEYKM